MPSSTPPQAPTFSNSSSPRCSRTEGQPSSVVPSECLLAVVASAGTSPAAGRDGGREFSASVWIPGLVEVETHTNRQLDTSFDVMDTAASVTLSSLTGPRVGPTIPTGTQPRPTGRRLDGQAEKTSQRFPMTETERAAARPVQPRRMTTADNRESRRIRPSLGYGCPLNPPIGRIAIGPQIGKTHPRSGEPSRQPVRIPTEPAERKQAQTTRK